MVAIYWGSGMHRTVGREFKGRNAKWVEDVWKDIGWQLARRTKTVCVSREAVGGISCGWTCGIIL